MNRNGYFCVIKKVFYGNRNKITSDMIAISIEYGEIFYLIFVWDSTQ